MFDENGNYEFYYVKGIEDFCRELMFKLQKVAQANQGIFKLLKEKELMPAEEADKAIEESKKEASNIWLHGKDWGIV